MDDTPSTTETLAPPIDYESIIDDLRAELATHNADKTHVSGLMKWLIGLMLPIVLAGGAMQLTQTMQLRSVLQDVSTLTKTTSKMADTLDMVVKHDVADLRTRLTLMESKRILPDAVEQFREVRVEINRIEERIHKIELKMAMP